MPTQTAPKITITKTFDQLAKAQEATFDRLKDGNESLASWSRSANKSAQQFQKRMTKRVNKQVPSISLPAPQKLADAYFDFAAKSIELNRDLVGNVIDTWAPAKKTARKAPRKPAARKTAKTTTKK